MNMERDPSPVYLISFSFACAGIAFAGIGLWAAIAGVVGGEPLDGVNKGGGIGTALAFVTAYSERATRWNKLDLLTRQTVLSIIIAVLSASLLATLVCLFLAVTRLGLPVIATAFGGLAALCQISTWIWFGRLRRGQ